MTIQREIRRPASALPSLLCLSLLAGLAAAPVAEAATGRSFIGPHEYALPGNVPDGFNVFVFYAYMENADRAFDARGDEVDANDTTALVNLFKFSQAWTLESNPDFGYAWEVILPVSSVRDRTANTSASGIGDPTIAPYIYYKLSENVTIGTDLLFQVPVGDSSVGGGDSWKVTNSVFLDVQLGKFNYTGDIMWDFPGESTRADAKAGKTWSTEHLFGYRATSLVEPYVGAAYAYQKASSINLANSETDLVAGMLFHLRKGSFGLHWAHAIDGKNRPAGDSLNVRFVLPM